MKKEERLEKVCRDFSSLNEDQQDYILGILQALVFARNSNSQQEVENLLNNSIQNSNFSEK